MAKDSNYSERLITPEGIACFPSLFERKKFKNDTGEGKYGVIMVFDEEAQKTPEWKAMVKAIRVAVRERFGPEALAKLTSLNDVPEMFKSKYANPFRAASEYEDEYGEPFNMSGAMFVAFRTTQAPGVVKRKKNGDVQEVIDPSEVYGGAIIKCSCVGGAFDAAGNKGGHFLLNNVLKVKDGKRFDNRKSAAEDFGGGEGDYAGIEDIL